MTAQLIGESLAFLRGLKKPALFGAGAAVVTALLSLLMPNYYRSEARLLPVETRSGAGLGGLAAAAAAFGVNVPGGDGGDANYLDIVNSRWMREQLLKSEFSFHVRWSRFGPEKVEKMRLYDYVKAQNMDRGLNAIGRLVSANRDLKSKVISISVETVSPELSQQVAQRVVQLLEVFLQEKGRTRGGAKAAFAESRLTEARREMDEAEAAFSRFMETNRNYQSSSDPAVRLRGNRLESELRLRQQLVSTLALNREQALLEEKNDMPILNLLDAPNQPIDKSRPARLNFALAAFVMGTVLLWAIEHIEWILAQVFGQPGSTTPGDGVAELNEGRS